ncbi:hypothetical protein [Niallia endozanthoxylica]|uniref:Uncharacterized protein n=1 Tax=Niallia endozanthoxylica TaxID=2036016 RepID=A0A5J5I3K8_9BACI|nr:hypothetical protein [Niallia endozanthoxylica]KAA9029906.1 hypothetical protein F4V44_02560 [Niallia endozanthoxylica]
MFFLLLTGMIIAFIVGVALLIQGEILFGSIGISAGILLLLFIVIYYGKNKRKKKYDCTPDCGFPDCNLGPDCDCGPNCD